jgi:hypothetical protein
MKLQLGGQKMKLLIANWQIVAAQCGVFNFLSYPGNFGRFVNRISIVSLNATSLLPSLACKADFIDQLVIVTLVPPALILSAVLVWRVYVAVRRPTEDAAKTWKKRVIVFILVLSFVIYTGVSATLFQTLRCDAAFDGEAGEADDSRVFGNSYLIADYSINCGSRRYRAARVYALVMLCIYPFGTPLAYFLVLKARRHEVHPTSEEALELAKALFSKSTITALAHGLRRASLEKSTILSANGRSVQERHRALKQDELKIAAAEYLKVSATLGYLSDAAKLLEEKVVMQNRQLNRDISQLRFLYLDYSPGFYYFEVVMCFIKLSVTCVLPAIIESENHLELLYCTTVATSAVALLLPIIRPFSDRLSPASFPLSAAVHAARAQARRTTSPPSLTAS